MVKVFHGTIFYFGSFDLVYVGRIVITNMPIYLMHCDLQCHMWQILTANIKKSKIKSFGDAIIIF